VVFAGINSLIPLTGSLLPKVTLLLQLGGIFKGVSIKADWGRCFSHTPGAVNSTPFRKLVRPFWDTVIMLSCFRV